jgi:ammonium transporter Rh
MNRSTADAIFYALLVLTQIIAVIFYGVFHDQIFDPARTEAIAVTANASRYPVFQDIHIMVFVGMGFLFAFLKRYRLSGVTEVFWLAAITVQYYFLWKALFYGAWESYGHFITDTSELIRGEYCAISMVVAFGAIIGKSNNLQILIAALIGILLYCINEQILFNSLDVKDIGGSMYIFTFGGWYGLGLSWILNYKDARESHNFLTDVNASSFGLIGTLFLWCFFPSFNSALAADVLSSNMAVTNTYFCLIGSVLGAYLASKILFGGKFHVEHILNATLVGGILMGSGADILRDSFVAYIVGGVGGIIATLGLTYFRRLDFKFGLNDVAGVTHVFAWPGIFGGLLSAIYRARYYDRGGIQVAGTFISFAIAFVGALIVGVIIRWLGSQQSPDEYYNDDINVHYENESEYNADPKPFWDRHNRILFGHVHQRKLVHHVQSVNNYENNQLNDREVAPDL